MNADSLFPANELIQNFPSLGKSVLFGEIVRGPKLSAMYEGEYNCTFRASGQSSNPLCAGVKAYLVLASGEVVSVEITGVKSIVPMPEAVKSGAWSPSDIPLLFRAPGLTEEQVKQARIFILP
jgi:hypothetical protein